MTEPKYLSSLNLEGLQEFENEFSQATGLGVITVDCRGVPVTPACGFSTFCQEVRKDPLRRAMCYSCDAHGGLQAAIDGSPRIYRCHTGLVDFSVPIVSGERYLGAILCGQVRVEHSDDDPGFLVTNDESWHADHVLSDLYSEIRYTTVGKVRSAANLLARLARSFVQQAITPTVLDSAAIPATVTPINALSASVSTPVPTEESSVPHQTVSKLSRALADEDLPAAMAALSEKLDEIRGALVSRDILRVLEDELLHAAQARGAKVVRALQQAMSYGRSANGLDRYTVQLHLEAQLRLIITADQRINRPSMAGLLNQMARQPNRAWTLSEAANYLGMSFSHASKQFKAFTGVNFVAYTAARRLERAQLMLRYTDMKVARIAKSLGFLPNYFSRAFRDATGHTPSDYRRKFAATRLPLAA
jgi:ligand-binding sensor protein/AraC-like DNA-binding protein